MRPTVNPTSDTFCSFRHARNSRITTTTGIIIVRIRGIDVTSACMAVTPGSDTIAGATAIIAVTITGVDKRSGVNTCTITLPSYEIR